MDTIKNDAPHPCCTYEWRSESGVILRTKIVTIELYVQDDWMSDDYL